MRIVIDVEREDLSVLTSDLLYAVSMARKSIRNAVDGRDVFLDVGPWESDDGVRCSLRIEVQA